MSNFSLGKAVRLRRLALGLTQQQVAEMADVGPQYVARLETARSLEEMNPTLMTMIAIASALDTSVPSLLEETNQPLSRRRGSATSARRELIDLLGRLTDEDVKALAHIAARIVSADSE